MTQLPPTEKAIRSGDSKAFDRLHRDLSPRVSGYLRRFTKDSAEAEDLTQETFAAAYAGRQTYNGSAQPIAWLIGIARRRLRDGRRKFRPDQDELSEELLSTASPEADAVRSIHLMACLNQIDKANRDALMLVFSQGLTYAEAADELGEPIGTIKWRVHTASRQMRELLRAGEGEKLP